MYSSHKYARRNRGSGRNIKEKFNIFGHHFKSMTPSISSRLPRTPRIQTILPHAIILSVWASFFSHTLVMLFKNAGRGENLKEKFNIFGHHFKQEHDAFNSIAIAPHATDSNYFPMQISDIQFSNISHNLYLSVWASTFLKTPVMLIKNAGSGEHFKETFNIFGHHFKSMTPSNSPHTPRIQTMFPCNYHIFYLLRVPTIHTYQCKRHPFWKRRLC